ncbi:hypothetical protein BV377_27580, partial [Klebsiella pneumoniae]
MITIICKLIYKYLWPIIKPLIQIESGAYFLIYLSKKVIQSIFSINITNFKFIRKFFCNNIKNRV